jgi:RNA polymerase sigma-70 factor (ECF subfamily)
MAPELAGGDQTTIPGAPADPAGPPPIDATTAQLLLHTERLRLQRYVEGHLPPVLSTVVQPVDVLQDVYVEAFRRIAQFRPRDETSVYRWLVTIARNHMSMLLRAYRSRKRAGGSGMRTLSGGGDSLVVMLSELADGRRRTPSGSAAAHEFTAALERAVERLAPGPREAVRLRYLEGLTPAEAAEKMGRSIPAIHMLCQRALQTLRHDLRSASLYL